MPNAAESLRKLNRKARKAGTKRTVFLNSMSDFFEDHVGEVLELERNRTCLVEEGRTLHDLRREAFQVIDQCESLIFIILTKRPENIGRMMPMRSFWPNVWLMTSVSNQAEADREIPKLLAYKRNVPVIGISAEPLLGPIDLRRIELPNGDLYDVLLGEVCSGKTGCMFDDNAPYLDWVIVGGESGPGARPCNVEWIRSIVQQCKNAGVACFVKQLGENVKEKSPDAFVWLMQDKKGGDPAEWPEDIRVRQYPKGLCQSVTE